MLILVNISLVAYLFYIRGKLLKQRHKIKTLEKDFNYDVWTE